MMSTQTDGWGYGLRLRVIYDANLGTYCGYVYLPAWHWAHGLDYSDQRLDHIRVHGGLTHSALVEPTGDPSEPSGWVLGWDAAPFVDRTTHNRTGHLWTELEARRETGALAFQLAQPPVMFPDHYSA